jgi:hypothetical protein
MEKLSASVITSFKNALKLLTGYERRQYAADLSKTYFDSSPRKTERALGVSRTVVETGLGEQNSGIHCKESFSLRGRKKKKTNLTI